MNTSSADLTVTLPRKRTGAAVLFSAPDGRALLLEPAYKDFWEIPGGVVEMNESPHDAATREIQEKLGLSVRVGRLLVVDWEPPRTDRTEGIMFIYAGGSLDRYRRMTFASTRPRCAAGAGVPGRRSTPGYRKFWPAG